MIIRLIAIGTRMPHWVETGFQEYAKRLPKDYQLTCMALEAEKRGKQTDLNKIMAQESQRLYDAAPKTDTIIALDRTGKALDTKMLAAHLENYHDQSQSMSLLVGGPEGISQTILSQCNSVWSLSPMTLPHPLVRIMLAEQCYRAWSIITNHPYHR